MHPLTWLSPSLLTASSSLLPSSSPVFATSLVCFAFHSSPHPALGNGSFRRELLSTSATPVTCPHTTRLQYPAMPGLVNDVTRIWEVNLHWPVNAQCGVWNSKQKGVDVWECIRARESQIFILA